MNYYNIDVLLLKSAGSIAIILLIDYQGKVIFAQLIETEKNDKSFFCISICLIYLNVSFEKRTA